MALDLSQSERTFEVVVGLGLVVLSGLKEYKNVAQNWKTYEEKDSLKS